MAKGIKVEVKPPIDSIRKRLRAQQVAMRNLKSPLSKVAIVLDQWVQRNFKSEGGEVGGWVPFKKNAAGVPLVEVREPDRAPAKLLQRTGRLRISFSPFVLGSTTAGIGSDLPYARTHHKGEGHVPERPLLPEKGAARRTVLKRAEQILRAHVKEVLRK